MDNPVPVPSRLRIPFDGTPRVTQWYGENPAYYAQFGVAGHNGIDFGLVTGTPLRAACEGRVTRVRKDSTGYGWHVYVNHGWGQTLYAHMSRIDVAEQQDVEEGEVLGLSGNTGNSTGPHLHFGLRIYGVHVPNMSNWCDPAPILGLRTWEETAMDESTKTQIRNLMWNRFGVPYNPDAALAKFAKAKGLGAPKAAESKVTVNGKVYVVQPYDGAIAAVPDGQWDKCEAIPWL